MTEPTRGRTRKLATTAVLCGLAVFLVIALYLTKNIFKDPDNLPMICAQMLPQNQRVGMSFEPVGKGLLKIHFDGQRGVATGATPEQMEKVVSCIERVQGRVVIDNGVRLPLEPVGQVANRWGRESGLHLRLLPGSNDEALDNLRIGPAVGLKETVITDWCSPQQAGSCVTCEPSNPTKETNEVLVRLREGAPADKRQLDGLSPIPPPGVTPEPWQIVNQKGQRFYYECKHP
jgi:hypothetical protein